MGAREIIAVLGLTLAGLVLLRSIVLIAKRMRVYRKRRRESLERIYRDGMVCIRCGYNMRANPMKCSECGYEPHARSG